MQAQTQTDGDEQATDRSGGDEYDLVKVRLEATDRTDAELRELANDIYAILDEAGFALRGVVPVITDPAQTDGRDGEAADAGDGSTDSESDGGSSGGA